MGPNIVCVGGGTGLPNLLRGLKEYSSNLTALVTVADDGGSSGILRDELRILPPGDIRNCLLALADTEPLMERLLQYRFSKGSLKGHSFGNLFLAAMTDLLGDFGSAIKESGKVLAVRGEVLPSTLEDVVLEAEYEDGLVVLGETNIVNCGKRIEMIRLKPPGVRPSQGAIDAIGKADIVILGPGSLYTSIIPNLLVRDLARAIQDASAKKVYVVNVMTQPGETSGYSASDHVEAIIRHSCDSIIEYVVVNTQRIPPIPLERYSRDGAKPVTLDNEKITRMGYNVIAGDVINSTDVVRHSPKKLADLIMTSI